MQSKTGSMLTQEIKSILISLGKTSNLSPSVYDTAWVARIPSKSDPNKPMFPKTIEWIISNQLSDGSWGAKNIEYYHDRLTCTLSSIVCLTTWGITTGVDNAIEYINKSIPKLNQDSYSTVGFEVVFTSLLRQAKSLNLPVNFDLPEIQLIEEIQKSKLSKIPIEVIYKQPTTLLHSIEGLDGLVDLNKVGQFLAIDGSMQSSPAATTYYYMKTGDIRALNYIEVLLKNKDYVSVNEPISIFEINWCIDILSRLDLDRYFLPEIDKLINLLKSSWEEGKGLSWSQNFSLPDLDDTAIGYKIITTKGALDLDRKVFDSFERNGTIFCFPGELQSSPTHLLHYSEALELFNTEKSKHVFVLAEELLKLKGFGDKWHVSPMYLMSIFLPLCQKLEYNKYKIYIKEIIEKNEYSSIEELLWKIVALVQVEKFENNSNLKLLLKISISDLLDNLNKHQHFVEEYLWIDKCLYNPKSITNLLLNACKLKKFNFNYN